MVHRTDNSQKNTLLFLLPRSLVTLSPLTDTASSGARLCRVPIVHFIPPGETALSTSHLLETRLCPLHISWRRDSVHFTLPGETALSTSNFLEPRLCLFHTSWRQDPASRLAGLMNRCQCKARNRLMTSYDQVLCDDWSLCPADRFCCLSGIG